jgi:hypothetical protein
MWRTLGEEKRNMCSTATLVMLIMADVDKVVDAADHNDQNLSMT